MAQPDSGPATSLERPENGHPLTPPDLTSRSRGSERWNVSKYSRAGGECVYQCNSFSHTFIDNTFLKFHFHIVILVKDVCIVFILAQGLKTF